MSVKNPTDEEAAELAYQIGALFMNYSAFEHTLNLAVAATFRLSRTQSNALVRGMYPRQKIDLLLAFANKHWMPPAKDQLKKLAADALALTDYRNEIAHGFIGHDESGQFHTITFRGAHRFDGIAKPLTVAEVSERVGAAMQLGMNFQTLADALERGTAQRKPSPPPKHPST